ncbi:uncharacterized protein EI90DRAFT_3057670, partial [Cantharellus anzutake]|uniref:uncharacterized protein n=1 Tax=Cantharellus anzutake TaxID=1750568 RepID=UPI001903C295
MCRWVESTERCVWYVKYGSQDDKLNDPVRVKRWPLPLLGHFLRRHAKAFVADSYVRVVVIQMRMSRLKRLPGHAHLRCVGRVLNPYSRWLDDLRGIDEWRKELYRHFCLEPAKSLAMDPQGLKHDKFIIAFDECTNMGSTREPAVPRHGSQDCPFCVKTVAGREMDLIGRQIDVKLPKSALK